MSEADGLSPRERRAQHAKSQRRKAMPMLALAGLAKPALLIGVVALLGTGIYFAVRGNENCPGHWHGTFGVFEPDASGAPREVNFQSPSFELGSRTRAGTPMSSHLHQSDGKNQFHFESSQNQCVSLSSALSNVAVKLDSNGMTMNGPHTAMGDAGAWEANGNATMRGFIQETNGNWTERRMDDLLDYQLKDGQSVLFAFGNYTHSQVQQMEQSVPPPMSRKAMP